MLWNSKEKREPLLSYMLPTSFMLDDLWQVAKLFRNTNYHRPSWSRNMQDVSSRRDHHPSCLITMLLITLNPYTTLIHLSNVGQIQNSNWLIKFNLINILDLELFWLYDSHLVEVQATTPYGPYTTNQIKTGKRFPEEYRRTPLNWWGGNE